MKNKQILILIPGPDARGGITNYYLSIKKHMPLNVIYLERGARNWPYHNNLLIEFIRIFRDYYIFIKTLLTQHIYLVQTATSLGLSGLVRDSIYLLIGKIFNKKVIIFFRGWNPENEKYLKSIYLLKYIYFLADSIIVLTKRAKGFLLNSGFKKKIYLETTLVDVNLLREINLKEIEDKYNFLKSINILFLARLEKQKGIYEAINTFEILKSKYPEINLFVAGDGREEDSIKEIVKEKKLKDIHFFGFVNGDEKIELYRKSHIYFFPSYTEGMPNSVLEAMGFGLPIITHNVGAIVDFFENNVNGFRTDSLDQEEFSNLFIKLISDRNLMKQIAVNNFIKAQKQFTSDIVANRIIKIFNTHYN